MKDDGATSAKYPISVHAVVSDCAALGHNVRVLPFAMIGRVPVATAANKREVHFTRTVRIGTGCIVGVQAIIYMGTVIGEHCQIGDRAIIREGSRIGDRCVIGANADVQYGVSIGDNVKVMNASHISGGTVIGDDTFIGPGVMTANDPRVTPGDYKDNPERRAPVIGKRVMIGVGAILLPGVRIGDDAVIGAGAVVTRDVVAGTRVLGMPARSREVVDETHVWSDR